MHIGQYISGAGHAGLIFWVLVGGVFTSSPEPVEVTQVSVLSEAEYQALTQAATPPETLSEVPQPAVPKSDANPELDSQADQPPERSDPQVAEPAPADPEPQPVPEPPVAEVDDTPPEIDPPAEEMAALPPQRDPEPVAQPAPRVAPEPVAPPEPDVKVDEQRREETTPDQPAEEVVEPEEEAAPEAAATEIVTEAEQNKPSAPTRSLRPKARPRRAAATEPEPSPEEPQQQQTTPDTGVNAALAEALEGGQTVAEPQPASGPPLTRGEQKALRISVQQCWVVDVGSRAASISVTLAMSLDRSGKVLPGSLKLIENSDGAPRAVQTAFQSARRAVLRCQKGGYNLPPEKYEHWRDIEMTFNPEKMRIK